MTLGILDGPEHRLHRHPPRGDLFVGVAEFHVQLRVRGLLLLDQVGQGLLTTVAEFDRAIQFSLGFLSRPPLQIPLSLDATHFRLPSRLLRFGVLGRFGGLLAELADRAGVGLILGVEIGLAAGRKASLRRTQPF